MEISKVKLTPSIRILNSSMSAEKRDIFSKRSSLFVICQGGGGKFQGFVEKTFQPNGITDEMINFPFQSAKPLPFPLSCKSIFIQCSRNQNYDMQNFFFVDKLKNTQTFAKRINLMEYIL